MSDFPSLDEEHKELKEFWLPGNANILGKRHPGGSQGGGGREFLLFPGCSLIPKALLGGFGRGSRNWRKNSKIMEFGAFPCGNGVGNGRNEDPAPSPRGNEGFAGMRS